MTITRIDGLPHDYDACHAAAQYATFYQSRAWAESVSASMPRARLASLCLRGEDDRLRGCIPFVLIPAGPFYRAWSMPYGTYGGPLAMDAEGEEALSAAYRRLCGLDRVIEVGLVDVADRFVDFDGVIRESSTHVVSLEGGFDAVWNGRVSRDRRQRARRAVRLGVTVERARDARDMRAFYQIYAERVRVLGTQAPFPPGLFSGLQERGGDSVRLYLARDANGAVLGGHLNFYCRSEVIIWYGMTSELGNELQANGLLYEVCIRDACSEGFLSYNLGGSSGRDSLESFKESLGAARLTYPTRCHRSAVGRFAAETIRRWRSR